MGEPAAPEPVLDLSPTDARRQGIAAFLLDAVPFVDDAEAASAVARVLAHLGRAPVTLKLGDVVAQESPPDVLVEDKGFGHVDVVWESTTAGVYLLRIAPGCAIPTHEHRRMREVELVLDAGLLLQGAPVPAGAARRWPHRLPHRYDNPTDRECRVLCVDAPTFQPDDEVEVPEPNEGFAHVPATTWFR